MLFALLVRERYFAGPALPIDGGHDDNTPQRGEHKKYPP